MVIFIRSTVFNIFLTVWTVFITTFFLPTLLTRNQKIIALTASVWAEVVMVALKLICNINYKVEGKKNLPASEPFIVAAKHQSMWETVYLMKMLKKPVFILKQELTSIPFYGWYLKWMGMISIKREDGLQSIKHIIIETKRAFNQGRSLIIFPEGTRIKLGENADIQPGIVAIQKSYPEIPIVPISLNSGKFWRKGEWLRYPGTVDVQIGEPIYGKQTSKAEFLAKIKEEINKL
ncbi:MAG: lysophospholipid acyltransferase family protein [Candidatus Midichloria sp.]|uniref:1-acylglycerol-3-phosphate O-acyltransferase n=1 Tax=Hyalomma marginatum TaxID=34627 RepID=A0A8S4C4V8_9ACAR|nr:1-acyl-sn-glycerol-3-phosphate acyltransferase [Hyalomma marginatum]CAG7594293.1 1-acyl-sn-glycerol-3-phosphate acyltransferase [Hyalomma marginatum]